MNHNAHPKGGSVTDPTDYDDDLTPGHGIVVRARNGDVIRYDPTGLVMRLSDRVIDDIALRLGTAQAPQSAALAAPIRPPLDPSEALDGIDAWDVRQDGDWLRFTARLPGAQGVRGFLRHVDGGAILADAPGAVLGLLGLGGPRAALATPGASPFPQHVVAPADDIGAVGHAGVEAAVETDRLEHLRERTHEALVAETILGWQLEKYDPLPLIVTRVETDSAPTCADLAKGRAIQNLIIAAQNLKAAAALMGKKARVLAVCLDYALEDRSADGQAFRDGMLAVMKRVEDALWALGFDKPLFVARFESILPDAGAPAMIDGQWELSWNHGDHKLIYSAPAYAFARDEYDRPTEEARMQMAELTAAAVARGADWRAPVLYLAEREPGAGDVIRVTAQGETDLILDGADLFNAGAAMGFSLIGDDSGAAIQSVCIAPDDARAVLVTCTKRPQGDALRLGYATRGPGALRDGWSLPSATGAALHRWALPATLPITEGRG
jgi:hypothetical protein